MPGSYGSAPFKWSAAAGCQHVPFTGLYCVGAREYDPRTARWLQRDPIGPSSGDPNLYRYCGNDPINEDDPSGLAEKGHHVVPKQIWENLVDLNKDAVDVFDDALTGSVKDHSFDTAHRKYSAAVKDMFYSWTSKNKISLAEMTGEQARDFVNHVFESPHPDVSSFLKNIAKLQGVTLGALKERVSNNVEKRLRLIAAKLVAKKSLSAVVKKVPLVSAGFFLYDWRQGGLGHACNEALWPVSNLWRR